MIRPHENVGFSVGFTVYGEPKGAGSKIAGRTKAGKTYMRDDSGNAGKAWRRLVTDEGRHAMGGADLFRGPIVVALRFYVPRGSSVVREYPIVRPDVLKLARAVEDALTGAVWADDAQIVGELLLKSYGDPRVEVSVTGVGVEGELGA